jgi:hypothetical protein
MMKHRQSGLVKTGFYGFSWTTLFFGMFPALFRGDFITFIGGFVVLAILGIVTVGVGAAVAMLIWAFFYNRYYTRRLLEQGYEFADSETKTSEAKLRLGVAAA